MYQIKPGRGPSLMGGVVGIVVGIGGIAFIGVASNMGAPGFFVFFGVVFVIVAFAQAAYNLFNATSKDRMSAIDITTDAEESDPLSKALGHTRGHKSNEDTQGETKTPGRRFPGNHCPFCGTKVEATFEFCPACGKDI
ncbi:MAG: zinc-ribbon domain-containing protein [Verrucomicrobiota bacterium]